MSVLPDETGRFGRFGGRFMPEALIAAHDELTQAWTEAMADPRSPASSSGCCGVRRREPAVRRHEAVGARGRADHAQARALNHTGAHKIRNVLGQALLTKRSTRPG